MCRLLGVVSRVSAPLTQTLSEDLHPFAKLSSIHCDGWGMSYWDHGDDLVVAKSPEAALGSENFWSAAKAADTDAAVLHLRKASAGMAPNPVNTHPFVAGSVAFAHNGFFSPVDHVDAELAARSGRRPRGTRTASATSAWSSPRCATPGRSRHCSRPRSGSPGPASSWYRSTLSC